jgi:predicted transcriptional regulator
MSASSAHAQRARIQKGYTIMDSENDTVETSEQDKLRWSADIVAAYVAQNTLSASAIPDLIRSVHDALSNLGSAPPPRPAEKQKPAVPISKSVHDDYIVCLEDGKRLKMLKRYLRSRFDMSPEEYRRKWGLPPDYPMVAPAYAARRSDFAKQIGLGRGVRRRKG